MKCLTIRQPWAELIAAGTKRIENRTWKTEYRGPLAIHAGAQIDNTRWKDYAEADWSRVHTYTKSAIVAVVQLIDICRTDDERAGQLIEQHDFEYVTGPYCWILRHIVRLREPVTFNNGRLGLWNLPDATITRVRRQLC